MKKWGFKNLGGKSAEVMIYDEIGAGFFGGLTAKQFGRELSELGDIDELYLRINSPGGSISEGIAIHTILARHPARVVASVDGLAASIATVVAMAADTIEMSRSARFMIHRPWGITMGESDQFRKDADELDKSEDTIIEIYRDKVDKSAEEIRALLAAETWFTAEEAVEAGFADSIFEPEKVAAAMANRFDLSRFRHAPQDLGSAGPPPEREEVVEAYESSKEAVDVRLRLVDLQQQNG